MIKVMREVEVEVEVKDLTDVELMNLAVHTLSEPLVAELCERFRQAQENWRRGYKVKKPGRSDARTIAEEELGAMGFSPPKPDLGANAPLGGHTIVRQFSVPSFNTPNKIYEVRAFRAPAKRSAGTWAKWTCSCPAFSYRKEKSGRCKHIKFTEAIYGPGLNVFVGETDRFQTLRSEVGTGDIRYYSAPALLYDSPEKWQRILDIAIHKTDGYGGVWAMSEVDRADQR